MINYCNHCFSHAFKFCINLNGKEKYFNIMLTDYQKGNVDRYVGVCLENGLTSRSRERDSDIALSALICDIIQSSIDINNYYEDKYPNIKHAGAIKDQNIINIFNNIAQKNSSLAFYRELRKKIECGAYFSESRYYKLAENADDYWLDLLSSIRMNIFNKPILINDIQLKGSELKEKYKISKYITKISEILSLSKLFEKPQWNNYCYARIYK